MAEALGCDVGAALRLGEDEGALDHRLRVQSKAFRGPICGHAIFSHRFADIGFERLGVSADAAFARGPNLRVCVIDFLNDRSGEASEVGQAAGQNCLAEVDIGEQTLQRIGRAVVRRIGESPAGELVPMRRGGKRQVFLAFEVMEEASFGQPGFCANVLDPCRAVALEADNLERRLQELCLRCVPGA
jgi:hypothetical protein